MHFVDLTFGYQHWTADKEEYNRQHSSHCVGDFKETMTFQMQRRPSFILYQN